VTKPRPGSRAAEAKTTAARKARFVTAYAKYATVEHAAKAARVPRRTHYNWLKADAEYAEHFEDARDDAMDRVEQSLYERGVTGIIKQVFGKLPGGPTTGNGVIGFERVFDTTAAALILHGGRPEKYRARVEHTGKDGAPLTFTLQLDTHERPDA